MWPDELDEDALTNVRRHLYYIRHWLDDAGAASDGVTRRGRAVTISADAVGSIDVLEFERLAGEETTRAQALDLYRGDLLDGLDDEWIALRRETLRSLFMNLADAQITAQLPGGAARAVALARRVLVMDPWRESTMRALMQALESAGDRAGALREYQHFVRILRDEAGAEPSDATIQLAESMSAQLAAPRCTVPRPITSFVGRQKDLSALTELCATERLVTITGSAGIGKTRLASEVARTMETHFADGARFVDLSALHDDRSIARAIAQALTHEDGLAPGDIREFESAIRDRAYLLVLDNCEHVVTAVSETIREVLRVSARTHILATSRVPLHLEGEAVWRLDPLELQTDAMQLFADRARAAHPTVQLSRSLQNDVQRICAVLDGVPLAIELAAARLRTMTLRELTNQLIGRMGAMAQALRWSVDLLSENERRVFYRIAVFSDGFTTESVQAVCEGDVSETIAALVDNSLVVPPDIGAADQRYRMLESVRQPTLKALDESGDADGARNLHAEHFAKRFIALEEDLRSARSGVYFDLIERDYQNIRGALEWLIFERRGVATGMRLALALSRYWFDRGLIPEAKTWMQAALDCESDDPQLRARVFQCLATVSRNSGDYAESFDLIARGIEQLRTGGADAATIGKAIAVQSNAARVLGDFELARNLANEAIALFEPLGNPYLVAFGRTCIAVTLYGEGRLAEAESEFLQILDQFERSAADNDAVLTLANLGICRVYMGDYDIAQVRFNAALPRAIAVRHRYCEAWTRVGLVMARSLAGQQESAAEELARAAQTARTIDDKELQIGCIEAAALCWKDTLPHLAAQALGCATQSRERFHVPRLPVEQPMFEQLRRAVESALEPAALTIAFEEGRFTSLETWLARIEAPAPAVGRF